ncbi:MAG: ORF6N domain-containing protein [Verrucomicrobiales bacterium]|nr:ORF6N domain-containing protein [Verrucomicrobiales bacterium]
MKAIVEFSQIEKKILPIRNQHVLLDSDVAVLYEVETKRVNEAVRNNPDKFPAGYLMELTRDEKNELVENFDHLRQLKYSPVLPVAFTEKGLYMLATILKSAKATQTTLAIVETFAKLRELSRTVASLSAVREKAGQKSLMQKSGTILADLLDQGLRVTDAETSMEIDFAVLKFRHTVRRRKAADGDKR